jgi:ABC-2 type transport system ATP-binding protein
MNGINNMFSLKNITKSFGTKDVLKGLNLDLCPGRNIAIVGRNGAGKSTLLKIIAGFIVKHGGVFERHFANVSGIIERPSFMDDYTGRDNLAYILSKCQYDKAVNFSILFGIEDSLDKHVKKYSTGMRQKLALAIALSKDADLYVLDEPFESLDYETVSIAIDNINSLRGEGKSVIVVTHNLSRIADYCDEVFLLSDGILQSSNIVKIEETYLTRYRISFANTAGKILARSRLGAFSVTEADNETDIIIKANSDKIADIIKSVADCSFRGFSEDI